MYKVHVYKAMRALKIIWEEFPCHIISNWWAETKLRSISESAIVTTDSDYLEEECNALREQVSPIVPVQVRMAIRKFLNGSGRKGRVEYFKEKEALFEGIVEEPIDGTTEEGKTDMATPLPSLKEQLRVLATAERIHSSRDSTKYTTLRAIADVQASSRMDVTALSRQTLVKDYFTGN